MTKTFCDRCGKEIKKAAYGWLKMKMAYARHRLMSTEPKIDWQDDDKYICPDCEDSYIHWFMNPQIDSSDQE